eukprot:CAMPEP_0172505546 /NCGR_PEP_ID=MMETSP1066-20121228/187242_1 /TAXON_ID=671091 /ORGANISM="Coscinodiscus wailesii, Strain CCMP2513" /LENGTH=206 /DNA_ID=CAMNT_0013282189 /DNA_START=123 /DNA_END=740 /DNA_ORIENTATION=+
MATNAKDIITLLRGRGWTASSITETQFTSPALIRTSPQGLLKSSDVRRGRSHNDDGPKIPGGVYAIATNRGVTTTDGLKAIVREVANAGHVPSVPARGGSFFKLWSEAKMPAGGMAKKPPEFNAAEGEAAVLAAGGVVVEERRWEEETVVYFNLVPDTTISPEKGGDGVLVVDVWIANKFKMNEATYLETAARFVEYHVGGGGVVA